MGTSRPVQLRTQQKGELLHVIEFRVTQVAGGYPKMPEEIYRLRNAFHDDLHDASDAP